MINFNNNDDIKIQLSNYVFSFIMDLIPELEANGIPRTYSPYDSYYKKNTTSLHKYGKGPFCKFSISNSWKGHSGVYALLKNDCLLYIGQCVDLAKRYNMGYGNISPKNCYVGGQSTNCKINALILQEYLNGNKISLYFYATDNYDKVEYELISRFSPPYNGKTSSKNKNSTLNSLISTILLKNTVVQENASDENKSLNNELAQSQQSNHCIDTIWLNIVQNEGNVFRQMRGKEFTYLVNGNSIKLSTTNRTVSKNDFKEALKLLPVTKTISFNHLNAPSYLYAILMDKRII